MKKYLLFLILFLFISIHCSFIEDGREANNQGSLIQLEDGNLSVYMNSVNIKDHPLISKTSVIMAYVFEKDENIKTTVVDSLGFSNEPGFYGYDPDYKTYSPMLMVGDINPHPITYLNLDLNQWIFKVWGTDGSGFPARYFFDYNAFQSLNHVVNEGDRFDVYFAVHFNAFNEADDPIDRFKKTSSVYRRPYIQPDLISPKVTIKIKLSPEGPTDTAGNTYDIPDFSTWYDPYGACKGSTASANDVIISEIAWKGTQQTSGSTSTSDEFLEIYNKSANSIDLSDWSINITSDSGTQYSIIIPKCVTILPGAVVVIARETDKALLSTIPNVVVDSAIVLANTNGSKIEINDMNGALIHSLDCTGTTWPVGDTISPVKTMALKASSYATTPSCNTTDYELSGATTALGSDDMKYLHDDYRAPSSSSDGTYASPGVLP